MSLSAAITYLCWSPFALIPGYGPACEAYRWLHRDRRPTTSAPPVPPGRITSSDLQWLADHDLELAWTLPSAKHDGVA